MRISDWSSDGGSSDRKLHTIVRAAALSAAGLLLAACAIDTNPDSARVDCGTPDPHGVGCQVQRTGGDGGFEACWAPVVSCPNGGEMTASACHAMARSEAGRVGTGCVSTCRYRG